jgi:hypothetical protein
MMKRAFVLLCLGAVLVGCGSSKQAATTRATPPNVLPAAATPNEWAGRIVNRLLRPLNQDLQVVNGFSSAQIRFYIKTQNQTTLTTIRSRMGDLKRCSTKLDEIGPPPAGKRTLLEISDSLGKACASYEEVADKLLEATELMSSGSTGGIEKGDAVLRKAGPASQRGSEQLVTAVRLAQQLPEFRRAGLKPSV